MRSAISLIVGSALACAPLVTRAQATPAAPAAPPADASVVTLPTVKVEASADASAQGLSAPYPGGQVSRGSRAGILGTLDYMDSPFSITTYTHELIQDKQAQSVGSVLLNDPTVRTARGFGNFQESYFIRGFILYSDDVAYNGLYSLLPRQYIATELFERVEVLRGVTTFLTGANPNGDGIGGAINLLPKRAPNASLAQVTLNAASGNQFGAAADVAKRFGPDGSTGVRINAAYRDGGTGIDNEKAQLGLLAIGLDWRSATVRLSGDLGWQDNRLKQTRPNVTLTSTVTNVPDAPNASSNFAQPWSYSNETDLFGTFRAEWDITDNVTAWAAYGLRRSSEANSLANLDVNDGTTGAATTSRFDNTRDDTVDTGELGVRGRLVTGPVRHQWVLSASFFSSKKENAYAWDFFKTLATNLYTPSFYPQPPFGPNTFVGNNLDAPALTNRTRLQSYAIGDTLSMLDDRALLTLGARYQRFDIENFAYNTGELTDKYDKGATSPLVGLVVKATKELSLYANYAEGLVQGETAPIFVSPPPVNAGEQLAPYVSKQVEAGLKWDLRRFGGGLALFQIEQPRAYINSSNVFVADGDNRHRGVELNFFGLVATGVRLLGGFTFLDAIQQNTGVPATDGKRVIGTPRDYGSVGIEWDVAQLPGFMVEGRVIYTGSSYADALNTLLVPGWTRVDLGARYATTIAGREVTLRARVDNVADKDYWASVGGFPGAGYLVVGAPRTFSLSASIDF